MTKMRLMTHDDWPGNLTGRHGSAPMVDEEYADAEVVVLLKGKNAFGTQVYSYLKLFGRDLERMFAKMKIGHGFNPRDFGQVIAAGTGEPDDEIKAEMAAEHNMVDIVQPGKRDASSSFAARFAPKISSNADDE